eukprot:TRINITY_DN25264_c0_g1_i1.p1 TRINITY_DN25264_c0_g1~~TRINITY_DN25264_c0_g1_i1.p1  ORF type:complete len:542 (-),score=56.84 TRINITY_DN25264_c0_g1_i1:297-1922(-)
MTPPAVASFISINIVPAILATAGVWAEFPRSVAGSVQEELYKSRSSGVGGEKRADFLVTDFGAVGDATPSSAGTNNTAAIRRAAAAVAAAGGGRLVFPKGNFSTGAFNLSSNMVLQLEAGAVVSGIQPASLGSAQYDYPLIPWDKAGGTDAYGGASDFQGVMNPQYQSFVHGYQLVNLTINGSGTIWGGGDFWWRAWQGHGSQTKGTSPLNNSRPHTIHLVDVKGLTIRGVHVRRSPSWTVHLTFCSDVLIDGIRVQTNDSTWEGGDSEVKPDNADGLDLDSCHDVTVRNSVFYTHDDSIAFKSGKDWFGRHVGRPTERILVENCIMSNAVVFGSEMSGGLRNIIVRNLTITNAVLGLWVKSMRNRGGVVENILLDTIFLDAVGSVASVDMFYTCGKQTSHPCNASATPAVRNVTFKNLFVTNIVKNSKIFFFRGLPESTVTGITIDRVSITGTPTASESLHVLTVADAIVESASNITINGKPWPLPKFMLSRHPAHAADAMFFSQWASWPDMLAADAGLGLLAVCVCKRLVFGRMLASAS